MRLFSQGTTRTTNGRNGLGSRYAVRSLVQIIADWLPQTETVLAQVEKR
jgi:hypothetical protein